MLGEKIGESTGRITNRRVLPSALGDNPNVEVCFEEAGKILGVDFRGNGSYTSVRMPDGTFQGEGQGIDITKDGDSFTWRGIGTGKPVSGKLGAISWRGCVCCETASPKLSRLNSLCLLFEYEVNEKGETRNILLEWK